MPVLPNYSPTANPIANGFYFCQIKKNWTDQWLFRPWVWPVQCTDTVAPEIGDAQIEYRFGSIKRENSSSYATFTPQTLRDWYLRIQIQYQGSSPQTVWIGTLSDEEILPLQPSASSGDQSVKAFGLMHLFDRQIISKGRVADADGNLSWIDWVPTFNKRNKSGLQIDGNRSTDQYDDAYAFSSDGEVWTNKDIVEYILKYHAPDTFDVKLVGQVDVLEELEDVHDLEGKSVWEALCHLIDRRRGIGFYPYINKNDDVCLYVFTVTDKTLKSGDKKLPANKNTMFLNMPSAFPYTHEMSPPAFRITSTSKYDKCFVRGELAKLTGTFSFEDENLEGVWSDTLETDYKEGAGSDDEELNDKVRSSDEYRDVYRAIKVSPDWDGQCGDGEGGSKSNILLKAYSNGDMKKFVKGSFWRQDKEFLRELPFEKGMDYSENPPTNNQKPDSENQFQELLVAVKDEDLDLDDIEHTPDGKWHLIDKLSEDNEDLHSAHVFPYQRDMGFRISCSPGHYFARPYFGNDRPTKTVGELSFSKTLVTATFEHDVRPYVKAFDGISTHETERTLTIDVPGAEVWYVAPNTVIDVRNGELIRIHPENLFVRNDKDKLRAVAVFARAWYEPFRQAVQIQIKRMGVFGILGGLLQSINGFNFTVPVRTVLTARTINFQTQTTTLETGWMAFDVGAVVSDVERNRRRRKARL